MKRRLFTVVSALSLLLLLVAVVVLWVRSYFWSEAVVLHRPAQTYGVVSRSGVVYFVREPPPLGFTPPRWEWVSTRPSAAPAMPAATSGFLGFGYFAAAGVPGLHIVGVPWWSLVILASAPPLLRRAHRLHRAARLRASGLCPSCGYDLRATPERCPECGSARATSA